LALELKKRRPRNSFAIDQGAAFREIGKIATAFLKNIAGSNTVSRNVLPEVVAEPATVN